jgi:hypothetical protein
LGWFQCLKKERKRTCPIDTTPDEKRELSMG